LDKTRNQIGALKKLRSLDSTLWVFKMGMNVGVETVQVHMERKMKSSVARYAVNSSINVVVFGETVSTRSTEDIEDR